MLSYVPMRREERKARNGRSGGTPQARCRWMVVAWLGFSLLLAIATRVDGRVAELKPLPFAGVTEQSVWVPMRDGVRLSALAYFPEGKGRWPVLFQQYYNPSLTTEPARKFAAALAAKGYVVITVSIRGSQRSEGTWMGFRALGWGEHKDGYDACEWFAAQAWCDGNVGTFGPSQAGVAQNFLAVTQPPHLRAQYMIDTGLSLFHDGYRLGGTTRPERFKVSFNQDFINCRPGEEKRLLAEWFDHPTYDAYWKQENCNLHFSQMNVPCFTIGSWFDFGCPGSIESFYGRQHRGGANSRGTQQLLLGPWTHAGWLKRGVNGRSNAHFDITEHMVRWFDHYLKGIANGVDQDPPVRYYVMGAFDEPDVHDNIWREAQDWPLPASPTPYYLQPGAKLTLDVPAGKSAAIIYRSDPLKPARIPGYLFPGGKDARAFEEQANVLTFTSETLTASVEWTGKVRANLFVSSTAKDTDFIVRVSDVYPDGRSILLIDRILRARYREGFDREVMMRPGEIYPVSFDVGWLSQSFHRGHRIRITIASNGAPFYEPNPNTGEPLTLDFPVRTVTAENTLYLSEGHPSHIVAPVVSGAARP